MTESASAGPVVTFPDPAIVDAIAKAEAPQERPPVVFSWGRSIGWSLLFTLAGSAAYAGFTYATDWQLGIIAIVIGVLSGLGAAKGGRGRNAQIVGACAAAFGYFFSLFLLVVFIVGARQVLAAPIGALAQLMWILIKETFSGMNVVFLAIAVWEGWKLPAARE